MYAFKILSNNYFNAIIRHQLNANNMAEREHKKENDSSELQISTKVSWQLFNQDDVVADCGILKGRWLRCNQLHLVVMQQLTHLFKGTSFLFIPLLEYPAFLRSVNRAVTMLSSASE